MSPSSVREQVVVERVSWVRRMVQLLGELPLEDEDAFLADARNPAAAESYLRRALEALLDLGRHIAAKGYGRAVVEYREIGTALAEVGVLGDADAASLREMAGYRNRMVHFYNEISREELLEIARDGAADVERVLAAMLTWMHQHPERVSKK